MSQTLKKKQIAAIYLFLMAVTVIAFWRVNGCGFVNFDDPIYVTENVHIQKGITIEAIRWAFSSTYANFWHPLTMISHMIDFKLFGLNPRGHHLTSLLFHVANTLLLFFVLNRMTQAPWKSTFVAALFAVHPLHVESVAWVAERKDVLSTFFWMLTMVAYASYVKRPGVKSYLAVLVFFVLGLMAKPMLLTLPFVMLLLDYWPLRRMEEAGRRQQDAGSENQDSKPAQSFRAAFPSLLVEKIPFFALIPLFCVLTYGAEGEAVTRYPFNVWISNAAVSYVIYIVKTVWPTDLAVFYPHPGLWPLWQAIGAALFLGAVTVAVLLAARRYPYLAVGWLWFTGALVPVIGIIQIGSHARADRYTYVPLIGLFIIAAWGIPDLLRNWRYRREALFASSALILLCLSIATWTQAGYWTDSISLYDHTLNVTPDNDRIRYNRAIAYQRLGDLDKAIADYSRTIQINPKHVKAHTNRGNIYAQLGNYRQAISDYDAAIEADPGIAEIYFNRGNAHGRLKDYTKAIEDYDRAVAINPDFASAYLNRGMAKLRLGDSTRAIEDVKTAARLNNENAKKFLGAIKSGW
jgi:hypothetical protein